MKEARHERRTANRKRPCKVLDRRRSARFSRPALDSPTKTAKRKSLSRRVAGERDSQDARPCSEDARFCGNNINNNNNDNNNNWRKAVQAEVFLYRNPLKRKRERQQQQRKTKQNKQNERNGLVIRRHLLEDGANMQRNSIDSLVDEREAGASRKAFVLLLLD